MEGLGHSKFRLRRATNASEQGQMSITAIRLQSEAFEQALRIPSSRTASNSCPVDSLAKGLALG
ncbi:MAG: hypothetical protein QOE39_1983 [Bradyrhizobium sp.]|nr:hypothetical protein [Bradyrhizobium sp.]